MNARISRCLASSASIATCWVLCAPPAEAGDVLDRIKRGGILHCAAVERPGYAEMKEDKPAGRAADLCRRAAISVLGPKGRFALGLLDLDSDFAHVRSGEVELAFLEPRTVAEQQLGASLVAVEEAYRDRFAIMLPESAGPQTLAALGGQTICFMIGDPVWPMLDRELKARNAAFRPFGFSEEVEMKDAYNVGRCTAIAGVASTLNALRDDEGVKHWKSRLLEEALGPDPVFAMVPPGDNEWVRSVGVALDGEGPQSR